MLYCCSVSSYHSSTKRPPSFRRYNHGRTATTSTRSQLRLVSSSRAFEQPNSLLRLGVVGGFPDYHADFGLLGVYDVDSIDATRICRCDALVYFVVAHV